MLELASAVSAHTTQSCTVLGHFRISGYPHSLISWYYIILSKARPIHKVACVSRMRVCARTHYMSYSNLLAEINVTDSINMIGIFSFIVLPIHPIRLRFYCIFDQELSEKSASHPQSDDSNKNKKEAAIWMEKKLMWKRVDWSATIPGNWPTIWSTNMICRYRIAANFIWLNDFIWNVCLRTNLSHFSHSKASIFIALLLLLGKIAKVKRTKTERPKEKERRFNCIIKCFFP